MVLPKFPGWVLLWLLFLPIAARAQGGPPYFTNDPGTPGHFNWEINVGYLPFFNSNNSASHVPDVDINFGVGSRIQLTYENAWLRVTNPGDLAKFGLGQSNFGAKWRFYDAGEDGLHISTFPQAFVNNPNHAVGRGIVSPNNSFEFPLEFSKKVGPVDVNFETGYLAVHNGDNGWFTGLVMGRDITRRLEADAEFYAQGTFHSAASAQPLLDMGLRYKLHNPMVLLLMAGRGVRPTQPNQPYFVGYFGVQFLLPSRAYQEATPDLDKK